MPLRTCSLIQVAPSRSRAQLIVSLLRPHSLILRTHLPLHHHAFIFIIAAYRSLLRRCTHLQRCADARSSSSLRLHTHSNVFLFPGTLFGNRKLFPYFTGHYTLTISRSLISHSFFLLSNSCRDNTSSPAMRSSSLSRRSIFIVAPLRLRVAPLRSRAQFIVAPLRSGAPFIVVPSRSGNQFIVAPSRSRAPFIVAPLRSRTQFIVVPSRSRTQFIVAPLKSHAQFIVAPLRLRAPFIVMPLRSRTQFFVVPPRSHPQFIVAPSRSRAQFIAAPLQPRAKFIVAPLRLRPLIPRLRGRALSLSSRHRGRALSSFPRRRGCMLCFMSRCHIALPAYLLAVVVALSSLLSRCQGRMLS